MKKTKYAHDAKTTIYHAMVPSEPETSGNYALEFPQLFVELDELGDDFERWYNEEKHVLLKDFQHEYRENLMSKGNYYAKLIYDEFTTAWVNEQYYKDLIVFFEEDEKKHFEMQVNEANSKNYQQARYHLEKRKENNKLILKAKAALYFINQTKAFVKPDFGIPDIIPPVSTSAEAKKPKKELTFDSLFSSDSQKDFVIQAMKDLQIIDVNGVSNLGEKDKAKLLGFIHALADKTIIPKKPDGQLVPLFANKIGLDCGRLRKDSYVHDDFKRETISYLNNYLPLSANGR